MNTNFSSSPSTAEGVDSDDPDLGSEGRKPNAPVHRRLKLFLTLSISASSWVSNIRIRGFTNACQGAALLLFHPSIHFYQYIGQRLPQTLWQLNAACLRCLTALGLLPVNLRV